MNKKTILMILILSLLATCLFPAGQVSAAEDSTEEFARSLLQGIQQGRTEVEIETLETDVNNLLVEVFRRYPALFYYFDGGSWRSQFSRTQVTVQLENTNTPPEQIPVVDSEESLRAVLGAALADLEPQTAFICAGGFSPEVEVISAQMDWLRDNHYLIWMGYSTFTVNRETYDGIDAVKVMLEIDYADGVSVQTLRQWRQETQAAAEELLRTQVALDMPDYEKVLRLHDWIIEHTRYNLSDPGDAADHIAYGALVRGSCVCQGYAEAFLMMAHALGLETYYVPGDAVNSAGVQESHGWNAVKVQGEWYMIDLTWDDPVMSDGTDLLRYDYFLVSADQLAKDHTWDRNAFPACPQGSLDANWVLDQHALVQTAYSAYDSSGLMTQEKSRAQIEVSLAQAIRPLPGQQAPVPTQPSSTEPPSTLPAPTVPSATVPQISPEPVPKEESSSGGWLLMVVLASIVALAGGGIVAVLQSRRRPRRKQSITTSYSSQDDW